MDQHTHCGKRSHYSPDTSNLSSLLSKLTITVTPITSLTNQLSKFFITINNNKHQSHQLPPNATIKDLKAIINPTHQRLVVFSNKQIQLNSTKLTMLPKTLRITFVPKEQQKIIYIKTLFGNTITLPYTSQQTIYELKELIKCHTGITPSSQRLVYKGKLLQDDKTIHKSNIKKESSLHLAINLFGS